MAASPDLTHTRVRVRVHRDGSGLIDNVEFRRAVRALGFSDVRDVDLDHIFREFDEDRSGSVSRVRAWGTCVTVHHWGTPSWEV